MSIRLYFIFLFLLIIASKISFSFEKSSLQELWLQEIEKPSQRNNKILRGKHVIFVSGFINEFADLISSYYVEAMEVAKELGATTSYINPPSDKAIVDNSFMIYQEILKIYKKTKKPLVLVGHSRGGLEIMHVILRNPELIFNKIIERALYFQPAALGAPMVHNQGGCLLALVNLLLHPDFNSLSPEQVLLEFNNSVLKFKEKLTTITLENSTTKKQLREQISNSIFVIRSRVNKEDLSFGVKLILEVMCEEFNEGEATDGLLSLTAQLFNNYSRDLGVVYSDHVGLVVSKVSNTSVSERRAIAKVGFKLIYSVIN